MSLRNRRLCVPLALLILVVFSASGCKKTGSAPEEREEDRLPKTPVPVRAASAERIRLNPWVDLVGTLVSIPEQTTAISPQTAGWVHKVSVVEGGRVKAGEELLRLDSRFAEAEMAKAQAKVREAAATLERLKHGPRPEQIEMARLDVSKAQTSVEAARNEVRALGALKASNEISPVQFQKMEAALRGAEAEAAGAAAKLKLLEAGTRPEEIAEAEARLKGAEADLATAQLNHQLCRITSPIDGVVTQLAIRQGMYLERSATVATVVDLSKVFAQVRVPSAYLAKLSAGASVEAKVVALPEKSYSGSIARISAQADPVTGDVDALAIIANKDDMLRPGLACRCRVQLPEIADAIVVPSAAVADRSGTPVISVVREGKCYEVPVKLGVQTLEHKQVTEGISAGDLVVVEGGYGLPEGCPVVPSADKK